MAEAGELTVADRVAAQAAIDRVYHKHRSGAQRRFEDIVSESMLEAKVEQYLQQSVALEEYWRTPVTTEMLEQETARMVRDTRMPERLEELFEALGNDPFVIQECLSRQILVDRLIRAFFAFDERIHIDARREAEELATGLVTGILDPRDEHPRRNLVDAALPPAENTSKWSRERRIDVGTAPAVRVELDEAAFAEWRGSLANPIGDRPVVKEEHDSFTLGTVLESGAGHVKAAIFRIPKISWDDWWSGVRNRFESGRARSSANPRSGAVYFPGSLSGTTCVSDHSWDAGVLDDLPGGRDEHVAVWTGSEMIVWGGDRGATLNTGGRYDPATDTWTATSTVGAPLGRTWHSAVWTGQEMLVWGGRANEFQLFLNTGGRYNPQTDTWSSITTANAPDARHSQVAFWTGAEMLVWGGRVDIGDGTSADVPTGGLYDPTTDTWRTTSTDGASGRLEPAAVWTGTEMLVWGGLVVAGTDVVHVNTGLRYSPTTDTWMQMSTAGAPSPRRASAAAWSGTQMIVWGGLAFGNPEGFRSGGRYNPSTNGWTSISTTNSPPSRERVVWTGTRMVFWGPDSVGGRYNPGTNTWEAVSAVNAPKYQTRSSAIWTGTRMIIWGGQTGPGSVTNLGGRYDPATDTWTPVSANVPPLRDSPGIAWTGSELIVWGGGDWGPTRQYHNTGSAYDPVTHAWTPLPTAGAPTPRSEPYTMWTGRELIVWGGSDPDPSFRLGTGALYDPTTRSWRPMTTANVPTPRTETTLVWTGSEMIVWGGYTRLQGNDVRLYTGGRYDPEANRWTSTSTVNAPLGALGHSAVWTGREMVVWGGLTDNNLITNTGRRYDPVTDLWTPTATNGLLVSRAGHSAVWTGTEMLVWGGFVDPSYSSTGARYDPLADAWTPTSALNAPSGREDHTEMWTGREMVVWGGFGPGSPNNAGTLNTGGRYDPVLDRWVPTSMLNAPSPRSHHGAFWTGPMMLVWGGDTGNGVPTNDGSRYFIGNSNDEDGDGLSGCDGDCNDGLANAHPGAAEICDGLDQDCNGAADDADADSDLHVVCVDCDDADPQVYVAPSEVDVSFGPSPELLTWTQAAAEGSGVDTYDVVRGSLAELPVGDDSETCLARRTSCCSINDGENPAVGEGYWYLVRARTNACWGSWGAGTNGGEHAPAGCAMPERQR